MRIAASATLLLVLAGCGDSTADLLNNDAAGPAGTACATASECGVGGICLTGNDFPGGTCSRLCAKDKDCSGGFRCVEEEGEGVCLAPCATDADCRPQYLCREKTAAGGGGSARVCIAD